MIRPFKRGITRPSLYFKNLEVTTIIRVEFRDELFTLHDVISESEIHVPRNSFANIHIN